MAAFRNAMIIRISIVLLVTILSIGIWYSRISPPPREPDPRKYRHIFSSRNLPRNSSSSFWDVEDGQLTADLIQEVVEELERIRDGNGTANSTQDCDSRRRDLAASTGDRNLGFQSIGQSIHALVIASVARFSLEEFTAVGVVSIHLRGIFGHPVSSCAWISRGKSSFTAAAALAASNDSSVIWGSARVNYVNESRGNSDFYDVAVVKCGFEGPVGANGEGGFLVLNTTGYSSPTLVDRSKIEQQSFVPVYQELPDDISSIQFEGPFRFDYAYCSPPLTSGKKISAKFLTEWFSYHRGLLRHSRVHYFFYDLGGIDSRVMEVIKPLTEKKLLTVVDMRESTRFRSSDGGQRLVINDCLQRSRFVATWSFFWDLDEYFQLVNSTSMPDLLKRFESSPWISLANLVWSRTYCAEKGNEDELAVERMRFRLRFPTCGDDRRSDTCHGVEGQRKLIANPRKVLLSSIHRTLEPEWNGVILQASIARINHFHDLAEESAENSSCWIVKKMDEVAESSVVDGWWVKDESLALTASQVKSKSKSSQVKSSRVVVSPKL